MKSICAETQSCMRDRKGNALKAGDIIAETVADGGNPAGAKWAVLGIGIGIEPSTGMRVCCIKDAENGYIACCYQFELMFFEKVEAAKRAAKERRPKEN